jgi:hypothetical protein
MVASIRTSQRLAERFAKAKFDSTWYATTIREANEQLQSRICVDLFVKCNEL